MRKLGLAVAALALAGFVSGQAWATHKGFDHGRGNTEEDTTLTGAHFTLNIIGVARDKESEMTGSKRHTIFVELGTIGGGGITTDIYLVQGDFQVCDGNGFDTAFACDGSFVKTVGTLGAVFQLPCNENTEGETVEEACSGNSTAYEVWARALGQPGGSATITTCGEDGGMRFCSSESVVLVRSTGKSSFKNVTKELTTLCIDFEDGGTTCDERFVLFDDDFEDWLWEYDNKGLRLAQLRFYVL